MAQNLIEKIVQKYAVNWPNDKEVHSGDYLTIRPGHIMTHDNTGAVIPKFKVIGATKIADPNQVVHTLDHNIQDRSEKNLEKYRKIEDFSNSMGCHFFPAGRGIGHQIMIEEGFAFPGTMAVASDSHSNMYGGMGCLGTPIVRTDAAAIWATGKTWWQAPPIAKVELTGKLQKGVAGKDVIIVLAGHFNKDEVLNYGLEFCGDGVDTLTIDQRLSIANMTTEWGALAGVFPIDRVTIDWLTNRAQKLNANPGREHPRINQSRIIELQSSIPQSDPAAFYSKTVRLDLSSVRPHVAGPNSVKVMTSVNEISKQNIKIHKAYLVSCVNSRQEDIAEAAAILRGKKVAPDVKFYVAAASDEVQSDSEKSGDWQALLDAGAIPLPPGCGPCIGLGAGLLEDGEVGVSATNRNFKGRMGSPNAQAYLASPAVVAASAISGKIDLPQETDVAPVAAEIKLNETEAAKAMAVDIISGFPKSISGNLIFCPQDNLNTDGIYPGKYTYMDEITPEKQAEVVMENYDPQFTQIVNKGDILAAGFNFGAGSSREQAATALKYRGIPLVIAGTFSETYKRNAINNGFLVIEAPQLIEYLKTRFGEKELTIKTGMEISVDFTKSVLTFAGKSYHFSAIGAAAQEIIVAGGLENWVKEQL